MENFQANGKKSESRAYVTNEDKCNNFLGKYTAFDLPFYIFLLKPFKEKFVTRQDDLAQN